MGVTRKLTYQENHSRSIFKNETIPIHTIMNRILENNYIINCETECYIIFYIRKINSFSITSVFIIFIDRNNSAGNGYYHFIVSRTKHKVINVKWKDNRDTFSFKAEEDEILTENVFVLKTFLERF